ncbi:MAG: bifunctional lysylphosphatidylglycerol flippase/synthetase MprF [Candidatus Binatia bacterium]
MNDRLRTFLVSVCGVALFAVALWILRRELAAYRWHDVAAALRGLPRARVLLAMALTATSYLVLTGYELIAFRVIGRALAPARIMLAAFVAYVMSHNVGLSVLGGGAVRLRLYGTWGLSTVDIGKVVVVNGITFWLGFLGLAGLALQRGTPPLPAAIAGMPGVLHAAGLGALATVAAYVAACALRRTPIGRGDIEITLPPVPIALAQIGISTVDWMLAAAVLFVLLPPHPGLGFPAFVGAFLLSQVAGVASHVPAGLGVFESAMMACLVPFAAGPALLGALLAYRAIYYLLPLVLASLVLAGHEVVQRRAQMLSVGRTVGRWAPGVLPEALAATTFLGGVILLASGATPVPHGRLAWLRDLLPLPVVETSHFLGSVAGIGLLLLARGLQLRLDAAYGLTSMLLGAGAVFSLLKGFDWEEALVLTAMLAALLPCRRHFYRRAALLDEPFSGPWITAVALVVLGVIWLLLLSFRHIEYASDLWWQFELQAQAPRALRAAVGVVGALVAFGGARLLRPAPPDPTPPSAEEVAAVRRLVAAAPDSSAHLALLGDKTFFFSPARDAFVMYAVEGRSWVAMGDPVGAPGAARELAWQFHELADRHAGWTVFYQVGTDNLPLYLDLGLSLAKLGEDARVDLAAFTLTGSAHKGLRQAHHRLEREGCTLEVVPPPDVPVLLPELRAISDGWLAGKRTHEKAFSLGAFDERYLSLLPVAIVRHAGRVVAFANLWRTAAREELSVDLMRHRPDAPPGLMDYLFVELMLRAQAEGYRWFDLGMAPLSGFEARALAPLWTRLGAFVFRHGEHFYNFRGLRQYKAKFDPVWTPRYLASPGGLVLPRVLGNLATLVSGGVRGVVARG